MRKNNEKIRIRTLENGDIPAAKALWLACFDEDDEAFVEHYFAYRTSPQRVLALFVRENGENGETGENGERLVSMLCFEENSMRVSKGKTARTAFVSGVCTLMEYRRRGYVRRLLSELEKMLSPLGIEALLLQPFDFAFYEGLGFIPFAKRRLLSVKAGEIGAVEAAQTFALKSESMNRIYSAYMGDIPGSTVRSGEKCAAVLKEYSLDGAHSLAVRTERGEAYALWWSAEDGDAATLDEFAFTDEGSALALLKLLLNELCSVRLPLPLKCPLFSGEGAIEPFNMIKPVGTRRFEDFCAAGEPFDFQKY